MRKVIVCNAVSLDGYYEGPGKNVMDMFAYGKLYPTDDSFSANNAEELRNASTLLLGRTSYDGFKDYWPNVKDDPKQPPLEQEISRLNNAIEKVVISDSLTPDGTGAYRSTTRIVKRADAHAEIEKLKQQDGKNILIFGSHVLWNNLLAHGLVDELHLMIAPLLVGGGTRAFEGNMNALLRLQQTQQREGMGTVWMRYTVEKA
jgi:dihydrofolate reductase